MIACCWVSFLKEVALVTLVALVLCKVYNTCKLSNFRRGADGGDGLDHESRLCVQHALFKFGALGKETGRADCFSMFDLASNECEHVGWLWEQHFLRARTKGPRVIVRVRVIV